MVQTRSQGTKELTAPERNGLSRLTAQTFKSPTALKASKGGSVSVKFGPWIEYKVHQSLGGVMTSLESPSRCMHLKGYHPVSCETMAMVDFLASEYPFTWVDVVVNHRELINGEEHALTSCKSYCDLILKSRENLGCLVASIDAFIYRL